MRIFSTLTVVIAAAIIVSCESDDPIDKPDKPQTEPLPDYYPLKIGNYSIFDRYTIDEDGNETLSSSRDSIVIVGDTFIDGENYAKEVWYHLNEHEDPRIYKTKFLRDSSGNIVDETGAIHFPSVNFSDTLKKDYLRDSIALLSYDMQKPDTQVTVPAGTFNVVNYRETITYLHSQSSVDSIRNSNNFYADGIGPVFKEFVYLNGNTKLQSRLAEYRIENQ